MPTEKPRITITVDEDMKLQIEDYQHGHRMKNTTQTITALIEMGLDSELKRLRSRSITIDDADEKELIAQYRAANDTGKDLILSSAQMIAGRLPRTALAHTANLRMAAAHKPAGITDAEFNGNDENF